jgi:iron uptake system component EfeO
MGELGRVSHTDLWDFDANVDGSRKLFELLTPAPRAKDAALVSDIAAGFAAVDQSLAAYANADGSFDPYTALTAADKTRMQAQLADLSEKLARIPGVLGLKA